MSTHRKPGQSIEEVMVKRRFEINNPVPLPDAKHMSKGTKLSQSLPHLPGSSNNQDGIMGDNYSLASSMFTKENGDAPSGMNYEKAAKKHIQIINETPKTADRRGPGAGRFEYLADYSEADKIKMMESLIRYTQAQEERMKVGVHRKLLRCCVVV
jgi:hypothetical protein